MPLLTGSYDLTMGILFMTLPRFTWEEFAGKSIRKIFEEFKDDEELA